MHLRSAVAASMLSLALGAAWAHGDSHGPGQAASRAAPSSEETAFGRAGDPKKVARTLRVAMYDSMHFSVTAGARPATMSDAANADRRSLPPGDIVVMKGETVRFLVRNDGRIMHEMVIGTMEELKAHAELMKKHPGMEHEEAYMAHVAPGKTGEIVWQFTRAGEFQYACLVPGHMEAGMIARITVR